MKFAGSENLRRIAFRGTSKPFLDNLLNNSIQENIKRATKYGMKILMVSFVVVLHFFYFKGTSEIFLRLNVLFFQLFEAQNVPIC